MGCLCPGFIDGAAAAFCNAPSGNGSIWARYACPCPCRRTHQHLGGLVVVLLITAIGAGIGTGSGWYGGRIEQAWMGLSDVFLAFPGLVLALAVAGVSGGGMLQAVLALAAIGWPKYARLPSQERSC